MTKMNHPGSGECVWSQHPLPRPDRLPLLLSDGHARHRYHERLVQRVRALAGSIQARTNGAMIADARARDSYAIFHLQERGVIFIPPGTASMKA